MNAVLGVQHTEVPSLVVTLFGGYSYDGLNAVIGVQHTEVPHLGVTFFDGTLYDGLNAVMTHSQMLGKFEYTRGPIFKVVLEC